MRTAASLVPFSERPRQADKNIDPGAFTDFVKRSRTLVLSIAGAEIVFHAIGFREWIVGWRGKADVVAHEHRLITALSPMEQFVVLGRVLGR